MSIFDDTRTDWGARPPTSIKSVPITNRTEFFTHWNGGPVGLFGKGHDACLRAVRADQEFHMAGRGWSDIGYNGLICVHARAIAGRGLYAAGAHCPNHNTSGLGMQFMVGKGETATPAMFARMRRLYDDTCDQAGRRLTQHGHSDAYPTECPGAQILTWTHQGMPTTQEDDMTPDQAATLDDIRDRLFGIFPQRYMKPGPNPGQWVQCDKGDKGARPARGLDQLDGNFLQRAADSRRDQLLAAVKAGQQAGPTADADAIVDELATRLTQETP